MIAQLSTAIMYGAHVVGDNRHFNADKRHFNADSRHPNAEKRHLKTLIN